MNITRSGLVLGLLFAIGDGAIAQETARVSVDSSGAEGNDGSGAPSTSSDGQFVAFYSIASNLVAGDMNGVADIFVRDRAAGLTDRVSVDSSGAEGNDGSYQPSITADGLLVAFFSDAVNLVAGDTNSATDVFVHDRATGGTDRVSVDSSGAQGNANSYYPSISADGEIVSFYGGASNLVTGDTNGLEDVFVHDRATGITERVSVDSSGAESNGESYGPSITADGQFVAFSSIASNLVASDTNGTYDVFVHDRATGVTERVSVDSSGAEGNSHSYTNTSSISADGRFVAFESLASNLVGGDTNGAFDIFIHDRSTGVTSRLSVDSTGAAGNDSSSYPSISGDGQVVSFVSWASNLVAGDTNDVSDTFVHDRSTGITNRVSVDSLGAQANGGSDVPAISSDGRVVAFDSDASNLVGGDTNGVLDVFVHERCMTDATWSNYGTGFPGTNGVPPFTAESNPVLGLSLTLDLGNSYGKFTAGLLFVGFQQTSIHSGWGGDLLVVPALTLVVGLPPSGTSLTGDIPNDDSLCGVSIDLQAIESDPGAAKGVSFTQGLELVLGH